MSREGMGQKKFFNRLLEVALFGGDVAEQNENDLMNDAEFHKSSSKKSEEGLTF